MLVVVVAVLEMVAVQQELAAQVAVEMVKQMQELLLSLELLIPEAVVEALELLALHFLLKHLALAALA
jgi:hypothetical protein